MRQSGGVRGQAVVAVTLSLVVLFGMLALGVDLGIAHFRRQAAQTAADAAALAVVRAALYSSSSGLSCGAAGVWCGPAAACPSSPPASAANSFDHGCMLAAANGFATAGNKSVTLEANTTNSVPTVPGPEVAYWATARVAESVPTLFGILLHGQLHPSARATAAAVTAGGGGGCIYTLDPHAANTFQAANGAQVNVDCGIFVNSDAKSPSRAMYVGGGAYVAASSIQVTGDFRADNGGSTSVKPVTGATPAPDPFANLPAPTPAATCLSGNFTQWRPNAYTPPPGTYCDGITLANGNAAQFSSGIYILNRGTFSVQGGSKLTGSNVLIYLTNGATVNIANGASVTLSAPAAGDYQGVLFYQDRRIASPATSSFAGGADLRLTGSLYFPHSLLNIDNGSHPQGTQMAIVAGRLNFQGGARLLTDPDGSKTGIGGGFKLALVE